MESKFFPDGERGVSRKSFHWRTRSTNTNENCSFDQAFFEYGPFLKPPDIKKIQNKLYELRIPGKTAIRIFYTVVQGEYYLLHAFKKKSQKTPTRELKVAIDRAREII